MDLMVARSVVRSVLSFLARAVRNRGVHGVACVLAMAAPLLAACATISGQDQQALSRSLRMSASAYCKLDGGAARALIRADHAEVMTVLWRNGGLEADAGLPDSGRIDCPGGSGTTPNPDGPAGAP